MSIGGDNEQHDAVSNDSDRKAAEELRSTEPLKRHGDALLTGKGTRHAVDRRDERPVTDDQEGRQNS